MSNMSSAPPPLVNPSSSNGLGIDFGDSPTMTSVGNSPRISVRQLVLDYESDHLPQSSPRSLSPQLAARQSPTPNRRPVAPRQPISSPRRLTRTRRRRSLAEELAAAELLAHNATTSPPLFRNLRSAALSDDSLVPPKSSIKDRFYSSSFGSSVGDLLHSRPKPSISTSDLAAINSSEESLLLDEVADNDSGSRTERRFYKSSFGSSVSSLLHLKPRSSKSRSDLHTIDDSGESIQVTSSAKKRFYSTSFGSSVGDLLHLNNKPSKSRSTSRAPAKTRIPAPVRSVSMPVPTLSNPPPASTPDLSRSASSHTSPCLSEVPTTPPPIIPREIGVAAANVPAATASAPKRSISFSSSLRSLRSFGGRGKRSSSAQYLASAETGLTPSPIIYPSGATPTEARHVSINSDLPKPSHSASASRKRLSRIPSSPTLLRRVRPLSSSASYSYVPLPDAPKDAKAVATQELASERPATVVAQSLCEGPHNLEDAVVPPSPVESVTPPPMPVQHVENVPVQFVVNTDPAATSLQTCPPSPKPSSASMPALDAQPPVPDPTAHKIVEKTTVEVSIPIDAPQAVIESALEALARKDSHGHASHGHAASRAASRAQSRASSRSTSRAASPEPQQSASPPPSSKRRWFQIPKPIAIVDYSQFPPPRARHPHSARASQSSCATTPKAEDHAAAAITVGGVDVTVTPHPTPASTSAVPQVKTITAQSPPGPPSSRSQKAPKVPGGISISSTQQNITFNNGKEQLQGPTTTTDTVITIDGGMIRVSHPTAAPAPAAVPLAAPTPALATAPGPPVVASSTAVAQPPLRPLPKAAASVIDVPLPKAATAAVVDVTVAPNASSIKTTVETAVDETVTPAVAAPVVAVAVPLTPVAPSIPATSAPTVAVSVAKGDKTKDDEGSDIEVTITEKKTDEGGKATEVTVRKVHKQDEEDKAESTKPSASQATPKASSKAASVAEETDEDKGVERKRSKKGKHRHRHSSYAGSDRTGSTYPRHPRPLSWQIPAMALGGLYATPRPYLAGLGYPHVPVRFMPGMPHMPLVNTRPMLQAPIAPVYGPSYGQPYGYPQMYRRPY